MGGERRTGLRNAVHLYDSGGGRGRSRRDAAAPPRSPHPLPAGGSGCGLRAHCDGRPGGGCPPHGGVEAPPGAARPDAVGRRRNRANEAHPQDHRRAGLFLSGYGGDQNIGRAFEWEPPTTSSSPSRPTEPVARIEAVLRRQAASDQARAREPYVLGDLKIDYAERRVTVAGRAVRLTATEYKLLLELSANAGRVLTYDRLL